MLPFSMSSWQLLSVLRNYFCSYRLGQKNNLFFQSKLNLRMTHGIYTIPNF